MKINKQHLMGGIILILSLLASIIGIIFAPTHWTNASSVNEVVSTSTTEVENLNFTLFTNNKTGKSEYKVLTINRNLTEIEIPEMYNNIPVTEVADNAFAHCKQLTTVIMPTTIKRIGNSAFYNCLSLKKLVGMTNVEIIGSYAFNNCTSLNNLILPAKLQYVGTSIIKNVGNTTYSRRSEQELYAMNTTWDLDRNTDGQILFGNQLAFTNVVVDGIEGYAVEMDQAISTKDDIVLYSSVLDPETNKYKPILNINKRAFAESEFGSFTIKHDETLPYNHSININSNAFDAVIADSIDIQVDITLHDATEQDSAWFDGEQGTSVGVFQWTTVDSITLPASLGRITRSMFSNSTVSQIKSTDNNIEANHLSNSITRIDTSAFEYTVNLQSLYVPASVEIMGQSVFNLWGYGDKQQTISIDISTVPQGWSDDWDSGIELTNTNIIFKIEKYEITFDKQGGINGTNSVEAEYGKEMPIATAPTKENYIFRGYYSGLNGTGTKYYNNDMTNAQNYDKKAAVTLYAYWKGLESTITFDRQGGTGGSSFVKATYGSSMPNAIAPTYANYIFQGYYSEPNGTGSKYYDRAMKSIIDWNKATDTTLYAHWLGIPCLVTLDLQGGESNEATKIIATYGKPMPLAFAPLRSREYKFQGFYSEPDGKGTMYYNANMFSMRNWDQTSATTLYAFWKGIESNIYFIKQGGSGGSDMVVAEYGKTMPKAEAPKREGFVFIGYFSEPNGKGVKYYDILMSRSVIWENVSSINLYAYWYGILYTVTFDKQGGTGGTNQITFPFYSDMPLIDKPMKIGFQFIGYYTEIGGKGIKYYNEDMSSARKWDIPQSTTLYALWKEKDLTMFIDPQGSSYSGDLTFKVKYSDRLPSYIVKVSKTGYNLEGYYSEPNGKGEKYYEFSYSNNGNINTLTSAKRICYKFMTDNITLYANFIPIEYSIDLLNYCESEGYFGNPTKYYLKYDETIPIEAPTFDGYTYKKCTRFYKKGTTEINEFYTNESSISLVVVDPNLLHFSYSMHYDKACVADGTLITLADGTQKPVEQLIGNELLLVWNLKTGSFDTAPILFIDHEDRKSYEVINLKFSDGTTVDIISEHAFWDFNLNEYVFLRKDAAQYIGHWFNKQVTDNKGNMIWTKVQLVNVVVNEKYTSAWSPVTYGHLCYYVNGLLSMPGATQGLINIFNVNQETMQYNQESFQADIDKYGLYTYEEFNAIYSVPEEIFDAFGGEFLKVSIGKGLITHDTLTALIKRYAAFFNN